jgi:hypothetical protein
VIVEPAGIETAGVEVATQRIAMDYLKALLKNGPKGLATIKE